ncbi:prominin-1-A-like isoform X2 [Ptychodera flava]|uniref:prominin-1-A-like isoform X2 n=1 Tax=Ptychodera flava TaxID=63121 RepID=UPI00396A5F6B
MEFRTFALMAGITFVVISYHPTNSGTTNRIDSDGNIIFADLPESARDVYQTDVTYTEDSLQQFIDIALSFIDAVQRKPVPYKLIRRIVSNEADISAEYNQIIDYEIGFVVCASIGILFILFMPIVGLCFCCCRLCGHCGGEMMQKRSKFSDCKRTSYGIILFLIVAAMTVGIVCTYVSNERIKESVTHMQKTIEINMADIEKYINNSLKEFDFLVVEQYSYVNGLMMLELSTERVEEIVGIPLHDNLTDVAYPAINSLTAMGKTMYRTQNELQRVEDSSNQLQSRSAILGTELSNAKTDLDATLSSPACSGDPQCSALSSNLDTSQLTTAADYSTIDIEDELDRVNDALQENITAHAVKARKDFDEIPILVVNHSRDALEDTRGELQEFEDQVAQIAESITHPIRQVQNQMQIEEQLGDFFYYAGQYSKYVWYIGTTLMGFVLVIVAFYFLGLLCGVCGHEKDEAPTERGCMSNCGGAMLMGGVLFCFIFAPLLMLLTTVSFVLGGNLEKLVCEPLSNQEIFDNLLDYPYILNSEARYFLGAAVLKDGDIPLTVSRILEKCQYDGAIYEVMMLEYIVNISELVDYRSEFPQLESMIRDLDIDLSDVVILDQETRDSLEDFNSTGVTGIDFDGYIAEIRKGITKANLTDMADLLDSAASGITNPTLQSDIRQHASDLRDIQSGHVDFMEGYVDTLEMNINKLKVESKTLQGDISSVLDTAETAQDFIQDKGGQVVQNLLIEYQNLVLRYADQYARHVETVVSTELGRCTPVWNLYESMQIAFCSYLIDSFNCFWFSLGWCLFFFIPSVIFAIKLAKHYRRMEYEEGCQDEAKEEVHVPLQDNRVGAI